MNSFLCKKLISYTLEVLVKNFFSGVCLMLLCFLGFPVMGQERIPIAVSELKGEGIDESAARLISDRLRTELFKTNLFTVLERGQMQDILKEQGFQQSGCTSDACVVEVGQMLGVKQMLAGSVGKLGELITMNVRLIDVETGKITQSVNIDCRCDIEDVLIKSTPQIAVKIARSLGGYASGTVIAETSDERSLDKAEESAMREIQPAKKSSVWPTILSAVVMAGGGVAGVTMNMIAESRVKDMDELYQAAADDYTASGNVAQRDIDQYQSHYDDARQAVILRNVGYGIAGLGALGVVITIVF